MRTPKRIIKIHEINGFKIYCLFQNGESRVIDFTTFFEKKNIKEGHRLFKIKQSVKEFQKVKLIDGTLTWENIQIESKNLNGEKVIYHYDIDPITLYELSELDSNRQINVGMLIKSKRKELGMTQVELATKSGTTKHYISKLENNKIRVELATLIRIIEGGLGKKLRLSII